MRTIRAPANAGKSWSWYCCAIVHGIRSPAARRPRTNPSFMVFLFISPSKQIYT